MTVGTRYAVERTTDLPARLSFGAAAGLVGTLALQALRSAGQRWLPETTSPIRQEPGEFMVETVEGALPCRVRRAVPAWAESMAALGLGLGYGITFGALSARGHRIEVVSRPIPARYVLVFKRTQIATA
jgi:hypothetical protein